MEWEQQDSEIIRVLNGNGENIANAQMRGLLGGRYLYVDDVNGFSILSAEDARRLVAPLAPTA